LLPELRAALPGSTYYFRDFLVTFYPLRLLAARELADGRWPAWNPYLHEGTFALPALYPPDLLHALWPGPAGISWLLTLHFPLAAVAFYWLGRELGLTVSGAFLSASCYSLGGIAISSLNLYVFLQALALAPLVILTLGRAARQGGRWIPAAALALAVSLSTLAVEFVVQGLLLALALAWLRSPRGMAAVRLACALALSGGLAALPLLLTLGVLSESLRGSGLPPEVTLANAVHPVALLQVLIPDLFGPLASPGELFWGGRFFSKGFPYFLTLYLGPFALALACAGAGALETRMRSVVLGAGALGLWFALGAGGGLAPVLLASPVFHWFRFPSKALLLPYLVMAFLAGVGADRLRRGEAWTTFSRACGLLAGLAVAVAILFVSAPAPVVAWAGIGDSEGAGLRSFAAVSCGGAAVLALAGLGLAVAVQLRVVPPARAAALLAAVAVADLARAGAGVNPQVPVAALEPPPGLAALRLDDLEGGRVFSYGTERSPAVRDFLARGGPQRVYWSFLLHRRVLAPYTNVVDRVEAALDKDLTSFAPRPPELLPEDYEPAAVGAILPLLRNAAVSRVLSLDPLEHPDLQPLAAVPAGPPGLAIHAYRLEGTWPRAYLGCRALAATGSGEALALALTSGFDPSRDVVLEEAARAECRAGSVRRVRAVAGEDVYEVESDGPGYLVTRDTYSRGWIAAVDGRPERVLRANGKHRAVRVGPGRHEVVLEYRPPGLSGGLLTFSVAVAATLCLCIRPVATAGPAETGRGSA
jgi:hypothetical protein